MEVLVRRDPAATGGQPLPDLAATAVSAILLAVALVVALLLPGSSYYTLVLLWFEKPVLALWHRSFDGRP